MLRSRSNNAMNIAANQPKGMPNLLVECNQSFQRNDVLKILAPTTFLHLNAFTRRPFLLSLTSPFHKPTRALFAEGGANVHIKRTKKSTEEDTINEPKAKRAALSDLSNVPQLLLS